MTTLSLNIDARGAQKGAKDFKRATDQVKTSAMQADSAVDKMGASVARSGKSMAGRNTFIFQNTANQLGDIAVQGSMGTNMFRVLGMQLPQIAGGFALLGGTLGVIAPILGVLAAIVFPILALKGFGKSAGDAAEELNKVADAISDLKGLDKIIDKNLVLPIDKATDATQRLIDRLRRQKFEVVRGGVLDGLAPALEPFREASNKLDSEIQHLNFTLGNLEKIEFENRTVGIVKGIIEQKNALEELNLELLESKQVTDAFTEAFDKSTNARALAENLLSARESIENMGIDSKELLKAFDAVLESSGLQNLLLQKREALQIKITKDRTEANKEAEESTKRLTKEFERQLKVTRQRMQPIQDAADMIGNSFERAFMSAIDGSMSAKDAFRSMASTIIAELYRIFIIKKITGFISSFIADPAMFGGLGGGGSFTGAPPIRPTSFDGGGYTGNGPRSGGLDGRGGFMAMLHPNETVVDHSRGNSGGEVVVNQTINVTTGVQQTVRTEIQTLLPQIAEASKAAVLDARRRGGSFANAF